MLTKNNNPKLSYLSRVLALPLVAVLVLAFTIKQKESFAQKATSSNLPVVVDVTLPEPTAVRVFKDKGIQIVFNDSVGKKISWNAAQKMGFSINELENQNKLIPRNKDYIESNISIAAPKLLFGDTLIKDNPLIVIDGTEMGKKSSIDLNQIISVDKVESIDILKGQSAIAKYGQKGKDGVIEIRTKNAVEGESLLKKMTTEKKKPLIIIDGKESDDDLDKTSADNIESMTVLKGETATSIYGSKASNGAIIITTKNRNGGPTTDEKTVDGVKIRLTEKNLPETDKNAPVEVRGYGQPQPATKNNQIEVKDVVLDPIFTKVEQEAEFPGGASAWLRFLQRNLNASVPSTNGAPDGSYTVELQFIVHLDGSISDVKASTKHGYGMEEEAIRALRRGPKWVPAQQNGKTVNSFRKQTITFVITSV